MATTYTYQNTLTVVECASCHMDFGVQRQFNSARLDDHATFYCPAGHHNHYPGKSETEKLSSELVAARRIAENERTWRRQERDARERAERQRAAARGQTTRIRNRIANGVCPCCSRSFTDVARHMRSQHPDFTATATTEGATS